MPLTELNHYLIRANDLERTKRFWMELEGKLRAKRNLAYAVTLCTEAVDLLHTVAGAIGIYDGYPIQRLFRDAHALARLSLPAQTAQADDRRLARIASIWSMIAFMRATSAS